MRRGLRDAVTFAAVLLVAGACTIEDAKDTRAADSLAAMTSKTPAGTSGGAMTSSQTAPVQPAAMGGQPPATPGSQPAGAAPADSAAGAAPAGGAPPATGAAPATGATGATNNLAPDSVDVGRRSKAKLTPLSTMHLEVDLAAKQLTAYDGDRKVATYRVAIGSPQWPTQTGQWEVKQVVWNPEWIPPKDEAWAESKDPKQPGAPDNPLGRAQLVYDPPRTVHGTNDPSSIGKAVSHGSIRMSNADIVQLARRVMEAGGAPKDESFYQHARQNRKEKVVVDLPQRVPIKVF